jgi:PhoPQ-activated pathogenicity-related protein
MRSFHALILTAAFAATHAAPALAQQHASDNGTNANGPITIIKNMLPEDPGVTVRVNGHEIDHLTQAAYDDITTTVKPGVNTLTITWSHPVQALNFEIASEPTRNNYKKVLTVNTTSTKDSALSQPGSKSFTFTAPGQ